MLTRSTTETPALNMLDAPRSSPFDPRARSSRPLGEPGAADRAATWQIHTVVDFSSMLASQKKIVKTSQHVVENVTANHMCESEAPCQKFIFVLVKLIHAIAYWNSYAVSRCVHM